MITRNRFAPLEASRKRLEKWKLFVFNPLKFLAIVAGVLMFAAPVPINSWAFGCFVVTFFVYLVLETIIQGAHYSLLAHLLKQASEENEAEERSSPSNTNNPTRTFNQHGLYDT